MVTLTPNLHPEANKQGQYPLAIRITKDRKSSKVRIGQSIDKKEWDNKALKVKKNHPNSQRLNAMLDKKKAEINELRLGLELQNKSFSALSLANEIRDRMSPVRIKKKRIDKGGKLKQKDNPNYMQTTTDVHNSFFELAGNYLDNLESEGKYNQLTSCRTRVKRFWTFLDKEDIAFEDITVRKLKDYKAFLKGKYKNSERSAINNLIVIRTVFNRAIRNELVESKYYPFGRNKIAIKFPESIKIGLTEQEITRMIEVDLADEPKLANARNIWLTSFYFAGMRISDVLQLKWSDIQDGRLYYKMGKNAKAGSLKIPNQVLLIFDQYSKFKSKNSSLIFQELTKVPDITNTYLVQRKINTATKTINEGLEKLAELSQIEKKLTSHIARHSFGGISGGQIPLHILQRLFRHSHITTTMNYMNSFKVEDADDALEKVINF